MVVGWLFFFTSCTKNPDEPIVIDPAMISPVKELKYINNGLFYFGFGNSGSYKFSTDVSGNQFKIILTKVEYFGNTPYTTTATYKYNTYNQLVELERRQPTVNERVSLKFFYTNMQLSRFEECDGNRKLNSYPIKHETTSAGRKLTVGPYTASKNGISTDTLTHSIVFDNEDRVIQLYERSRNNPPQPTMAVDNFNFSYSGNDVALKKGYNTYTDFNTRKDSSLVTVSYTRMLNENPVLYNYTRLMYGTDFYAIITFSTKLNLEKFHPSVASELFRLSSQNRSSTKSSQYVSHFYNNGVYETDFGNSSQIENTLDAEKRLIKSKSVSTTPSSSNYYTWEIVYE